MQGNTYQKNTNAWRVQAWASFLLALGLTVGGIVNMDGDFWVRGYLIMGVLFSVGTSFTLSKTVRDDHEAEQFVNQIRQAKTERMLSEMEK